MDGNGHNEKPGRRWLLALTLALVFFAGASFVFPGHSAEQEIDELMGEFEYEPSGLYLIEPFSDSDTRILLPISQTLRVSASKKTLDKAGRWEITAVFPGFEQRALYASKETAMGVMLQYRDHIAKHKQAEAAAKAGQPTKKQ